MNRLEQIDARIAELQKARDDAQGTPTEIYTRIVGYYRSLKNWNRGKREEYDHRVTFRDYQTGSRPRAASGNDRESMQTQAPTAKTPTLDQVPAVRQRELVQPEPTTNHSGAGGATDYLYFYRSNCPNCPPVSEFLKQTDIAGRALDVDTAEGMEYAMKYQVLSTPTVVLSDSKGTVVAKVGNVRQLKDQLGAPIGSAR